MEKRVIGKTPLVKKAYNFNEEVTSFKNQHSNIPPFHYSIYEAET